MNNSELPKLCNDETCTGCGACENTCPTDAIKLLGNEEGFLMPHVNEQKCIGCHKCEKACPVLSFDEKTDDTSNYKTFACWHNDDKIRKESSSGGIFSVLAEKILTDKGSVYGAAYDESLNLKHIKVIRNESLYKVRKTKYIQSQIGKIFKDVKEDLKDPGKKVLFTGTPCQIAGLKSFLINDYDNLICVDLICHGVPSNLFFKKYITWIESKLNINISNFEFRNKKVSWKDSCRIAESKEGKQYYIPRKLDFFYNCFGKQNNSLRECCYNCKFKNRADFHADITIGDFWGIGTEQQFKEKQAKINGISILLIKTEKGAMFIKDMDFYKQERTYREGMMKNPGIYSSAKRPKSRDTLYKDLLLLNFEDLTKKYTTTNIRERASYWLRENIPFLIKLIRQ